MVGVEWYVSLVSAERSASAEALVPLNEHYLVCSTYLWENPPLYVKSNRPWHCANNDDKRSYMICSQQCYNDVCDRLCSNNEAALKSPYYYYYYANLQWMKREEMYLACCGCWVVWSGQKSSQASLFLIQFTAVPHLFFLCNCRTFNSQSVQTST